ncbi:NAD(P)-dependent alcohol dehydrogenase [Serratia marcescens]|nr:aryl-alcohol dehydrogenase [Serratia marcescens]
MNTPAQTPAQFRAAVVREPRGAFAIESARLDDVRDDEVLVRVVASGLCHTDVAVRNGVMPTPLPAVLGHEGSGVVEAVGSAVRYVQPGDHVVLSYLSCGTCKECEAGRPSSCISIRPLCFGGCRPDGSHAIESHDGSTLHDRFFGQSSFADYAVANERNVIKVDTDLPLQLLGPLGCGFMTGAGAMWNELPVVPGSIVAVFGTGAVGLSAIMAARIAGATTIIAIDRVQERLALSAELGATHGVDSSGGDTAEKIRAIAPTGVNVAFDTSGRPEIIRAAFDVLAQRGVLGLVAPAGDVAFNVPELIGGCKTVKGIALGGGSARTLVPLMLDYYRKGQYPFDRLVQYYPLSGINDAVRDSGEGRVIKPVLLMDEQVPRETS